MHVHRFPVGGGLTLSADVGGDPADPAVLLLHGGGQTRHIWARAARALVSAGRYVVSIDLRGHGDSDWAGDGDYSLDAYSADVRAVIAQMPSRPAIIGYMLGGHVALAAQSGQGPDFAQALALINTTLEIDPERLEKVHAFHDSARDGFSSVEEAAAVFEAEKPYRAAGAAGAAFRRSLRLCDDGRWRWRFDPAALSSDNPKRMHLPAERARLEAAAREVTAPMLLAFGGLSDLFAPGQTRALKLLAPHAEYAELGDAAMAGNPADAFDTHILDFLERVARRADNRPVLSGVDPLTMRQALGAFGTGVTVITTRTGGGDPVGLTANSFTSVSLDPPLVLFCLDRRAGCLPAFEDTSFFAVNVLHIGQQEISARFTQKPADRWRDVGWETWDTGAPILQDAMACFECDKERVLDGGDHRIFIGRVRRVWYDPSRDPLLYFQGRYRRVHVPH